MDEQPDAPRVNSERNLFFRSIPEWVTDEQLEEALSVFGQVESKKVMRDIHTGCSTGKAFARFVQPAAAQEAMHFIMLNGLFDVRPRVEWARQVHDETITEEQRKKRKKVFIRNLPRDVTKCQIRELMEQFGEVVTLSVRADTLAAREIPLRQYIPMKFQKRIAFVVYAHEGCAAEACDKLYRTFPFASCGKTPILTKLAETRKERYERKGLLPHNIAAQDQNWEGGRDNNAYAEGSSQNQIPVCPREPHADPTLMLGDSSEEDVEPCYFSYQEDPRRRHGDRSEGSGADGRRRQATRDSSREERMREEDYRRDMPGGSQYSLNAATGASGLPSSGEMSVGLDKDSSYVKAERSTLYSGDGGKRIYQGPSPPNMRNDGDGGRQTAQVRWSVPHPSSSLNTSTSMLGMRTERGGRTSSSPRGETGSTFFEVEGTGGEARYRAGTTMESAGLTGGWGTVQKESVSRDTMPPTERRTGGMEGSSAPLFAVPSHQSSSSLRAPASANNATGAMNNPLPAAPHRSHQGVPRSDAGFPSPVTPPAAPSLPSSPFMAESKRSPPPYSFPSLAQEVLLLEPKQEASSGGPREYSSSPMSGLYPCPPVQQLNLPSRGYLPPPVPPKYLIPSFYQMLPSPVAPQVPPPKYQTPPPPPPEVRYQQEPPPPPAVARHHERSPPPEVRYQQGPPPPPTVARHYGRSPPPEVRYQQGPPPPPKVAQHHERSPPPEVRYQQGPPPPQTVARHHERSPPPEVRYQQGPPPEARYQQGPPPEVRYQQGPPPPTVARHYERSPPPEVRYQQGPPPEVRYQQGPPPEVRYQQGPPPPSHPFNVPQGSFLRQDNTDRMRAPNSMVNTPSIGKGPTIGGERICGGGGRLEGSLTIDDSYLSPPPLYEQEYRLSSTALPSRNEGGRRTSLRVEETGESRSRQHPSFSERGGKGVVGLNAQGCRYAWENEPSCGAMLSPPRTPMLPAYSETAGGHSPELSFTSFAAHGRTYMNPRRYSAEDEPRRTSSRKLSPEGKGYSSRKNNEFSYSHNPYGQ